MYSRKELEILAKVLQKFLLHGLRIKEDFWLYHDLVHLLFWKLQVQVSPLSEVLDYSERGFGREVGRLQRFRIGSDSRSVLLRE